MRTLKIMALGGALLLQACQFGGPQVSQEQYDQLLQEYDDLRASAETTRSEYAEQAAAIDNILQQLSQISGRTVSLRTNLETGGTVQLTQVRQIEDSIDEIKGKLAKLDALSKRSAELQKIVSSLKTVIAEKESEIADLKAEIRAKDVTINLQQDTIAAQHGTIRTQSATISAQQEDLRRALQLQAQTLYQAGADFEQLGDETPEVARRRDKAKVKDFATQMYQKAIFYYKKAAETGYPEAAYRITQVEEKMAR